MTFSHYSAEENNAQSKFAITVTYIRSLAIMMTLPSATETSSKNNNFSVECH